MIYFQDISSLCLSVEDILRMSKILSVEELIHFAKQYLKVATQLSFVGKVKNWSAEHLMAKYIKRWQKQRNVEGTEAREKLLQILLEYAKETKMYPALTFLWEKEMAALSLAGMYLLRGPGGG